MIGVRFWGGRPQRPQEGPTGPWISSFPCRCQDTEARCMAGADPTGLWARTRAFSGASEISSPHCVSDPTHAVSHNKERIVAMRRILCVMLRLPFLRRSPIKTQPPRLHARQRETILIQALVSRSRSPGFRMRFDCQSVSLTTSPPSRTRTLYLPPTLTPRRAAGILWAIFMN